MFSKSVLLFTVFFLQALFVNGQVQIINYPNIHLCSNDTTILDAGCGFNSYSWSSGDTVQSIVVRSSGIYNVLVTEPSGFSFQKQFSVSIGGPIQVSMTNSTVCAGENALLDAGAGFSSYHWSNGSSSQTIMAGIGNYTVSVTDSNGCQGSGSAMISLSSYCSSVACNLSYNNMYGTYSVAQSVSGALGYRFNFYDANNPTTVLAQKAQSSNYIYFSQVAGLYYNRNYVYTVQVEYSPGIYGPESKKSCPINFGPAKTTINGCGSTTSNLYNYYTTCTTVPNALKYRFTFFEANAPNFIASQETQTSNYLYFSNISGLFYGHTYNVTVEVEYPIEGGGSAWGPASAPCAFSFEPAKTTINGCGTTYNNFYGTYTTCIPATQALNYRFTFYDNNLPNIVVSQRTQNSTYLYFSNMTGIYYDHSYNVTVEVEYPLQGGGSAWGPASVPCIFNIGPAKTTVNCNQNYPIYTTCSQVQNATNYMFNFYDANTGNLVASKTQSSNYIYFNTVSGIQPNITYKWGVKAEYSNGTNTVWGTESVPCLVTWTPTIKRKNKLFEPLAYILEDDSDGLSSNDEVFLSVYPNPNNTNKLNISLNTTISNDLFKYQIMDMNGKVVLKYENAKQEDVIDISQLEQGMYVLKIKVDQKEVFKRFVKQ